MALSSAESELYAIVKACAEAMRLLCLMKDRKKQMACVLLRDASAALGVVQRQGLGKLRHVDCNFLFVQRLNAERTVRFVKVQSANNLAELCAKSVSQEVLEKHVAATGGEFRTGRPQLCAEI